MSSEILQSVVLGLAQGLGEFLPVSSTAHLILIPYFFGWPDPGLSFDVALHVGTLIAVLAYFGKDWIMIFRSAFNKSSTLASSPSKLLNSAGGQKQMYDKNLLWLLVIATIPGVLAGYFLEEKAETFLRDPLIIAFALVFFGLALFLADKLLQHEKNLNQLTFVNAVVIGLAQAAAIIPGVSRSGATMTAGLIQGLDRINAARFSFLLSAPIIFGAAALKIPHLFAEGINTPIVIGILVSAVSGYLAIGFLLRFVQKIGYTAFFSYRLLLGLVILIISISQL